MVFSKTRCRRRRAIRDSVRHSLLSSERQTTSSPPFCRVKFAFWSFSTSQHHRHTWTNMVKRLYRLSSWTRGAGLLLRRMSCTHSRINLSPARRDGTEGVVAIRLAFFRRSGQSSSDVLSQGSQDMRTFPPGDFGGPWEGDWPAGKQVWFISPHAKASWYLILMA